MSLQNVATNSCNKSEQNNLLSMCFIFLVVYCVNMYEMLLSLVLMKVVTLSHFVAFWGEKCDESKCWSYWRIRKSFRNHFVKNEKKYETTVGFLSISVTSNEVFHSRLLEWHLFHHYIPAAGPCEDQDSESGCIGVSVTGFVRKILRNHQVVIYHLIPGICWVIA